jgi:D-tagatose-1,6-bisphosphate aldolase subunit GatZ/KbaZ
VQQAKDFHVHDPITRLQDVLRRNREPEKVGVYAVCSAHPQVIDAAIRQAADDGSILHVESTSGQVNQFGGYTGLTPAQFALFVQSAARRSGLPAEQVLIGGDHLGPFPWRAEGSVSALRRACKLVRDCVLAGYKKIHLDASMPCADDEKTGLEERTVADRAAVLCDAAEQAFHELPLGSSQIVYVIGTEVPAPGGASLDTQPPAITTAEHVHRTLEIFQRAFEERGLSSAWERVVALVVQPGVDFGPSVVFDYDSSRARLLSEALSVHRGIVYEAHSTDYQLPGSLEQMVEDHFAILKVGPWLTFAFREAVFALTAIERELFKTRRGCQLSQVREALEEAMLRNPAQWQSYYRGYEEELHHNLLYGFSDRCRYYWSESAVKKEMAQLFDNLAAEPIPLTLVSQYLSLEYDSIRAGRFRAVPEQIIQEHVRRVLRVYAAACTVKAVIAPGPGQSSSSV